MGFVKDAAKAVTFGAAGQLFGKKKKPAEVPGKIPTMISTAYERPTSMIGSPRGGY